MCLLDFIDITLTIFQTNILYFQSLCICKIMQFLYWGKGAKFGIETTYTVPEIVFQNNQLASRNLWNKEFLEEKKLIALHCMFLACVVDVSNNMTCLWKWLFIYMPVYYCVSRTRNGDIFQLKTLRPPSGQTFCKIITIGRLSSQKVIFTGSEISFFLYSQTY